MRERRGLRLGRAKALPGTNVPQPGRLKCQVLDGFRRSGISECLLIDRDVIAVGYPGKERRGRRRNVRGREGGSGVSGRVGLLRLLNQVTPHMVFAGKTTYHNVQIVSSEACVFL